MDIIIIQSTSRKGDEKLTDQSSFKQAQTPAETASNNRTVSKDSPHGSCFKEQFRRMKSGRQTAAGFSHIFRTSRQAVRRRKKRREREVNATESSY
jgi:hypothetical protein